MVSQALQAHFDTQSLWSLDEKFAKILRFIDPTYIEAFNNFRNSVLWVLAENPGSEEIISKNLDSWINDFQSIDSKYKEINNNATVIASEWISDDKLKEYSKNRRR